MKKFLSTTGYLLRNANRFNGTSGSSLARTLLNPPELIQRSSVAHHSSLTLLGEHSFQEKALFLAEEKLHIAHGQLRNILEQSIDVVLINSWEQSLKFVQNLLISNRVSEAKRRNEVLIEEIEKYPHLHGQVKLLLCEANVIKGNILGRTSPYEADQQEALSCYRKALELVPGHLAAQKGFDFLSATRQESIQVVAVDSSESPFSFKG